MSEDVYSTLPQTVLKSNLKKKTRLGFFYKRTVTLTDEPRIYHRRDNGMTKSIMIRSDTKVERLDNTKFKIISMEKKKTMYVFRCHDIKECDMWVGQILSQIDKLSSGKLSLGPNTVGSQSMLIQSRPNQSEMQKSPSQSSTSFVKQRAPPSRIQSNQQVSKNLF